MSQSPDDPVHEAPFLSHLMELKDRLTRCVIAIIAVFIVFAPFAFEIFDLLVEPLTSHFPNHTEALIAFKIVSPILTPYKLVLVLSVYVVMPYLLYQLWAFIAPGLYQHEKKLMFPLVVSSGVLYYVGMAFAYFVVLPLVFGFLTSVGPESMQYTPDISEYLDFVLAVFLAFGLAFEVPIATILLIATGLADVESLKAKRPYVVIGAFVLGMFLTPPDVISQTLLAVPMWLLFEAGLFFSSMFVKDRSEDDSGAENSIGGNAAAATAAGAAGVAGATAADAGEGSVVSDIEDPVFGDADEYRPMTEAEMERELEAMDDDDEEYEDYGNDADDDDEDPFEDEAAADKSEASEESAEKSEDSENEKESDKDDKKKKEEEIPWHKQVHDDDYADEP